MDSSNGIVRSKTFAYKNFETFNIILLHTFRQSKNFDQQTKKSSACNAD